MPTNIASNFTAVTPLGLPLQEFHLRHNWLVRWGNFILASCSLAGAAVVLVFGAYQAYLFYYQFGPAIVWKTVELPIILEIVLLVIGLTATRAAYKNWKRAATLYENGFTYQDWKGIQVWPWDKIQNYRTLVYRHYAAFLYMGDTHQCLLEKSTGPALVLNDDFELIEQLIGRIRENVFPQLYTHLTYQFLGGKNLEFGELTISLARGIEYHKKSFCLKMIDSVTAINGLLKINLKDENKQDTLKLPAAKLPNLDVLLAIFSDIKSNKLEI